MVLAGGGRRRGMAVMWVRDEFGDNNFLRVTNNPLRCHIERGR